MSSILEEVRGLVGQGVREITFLGQNVNSYCDPSSVSSYFTETEAYGNAVPGFKSVYKTRQDGARFVDLMDRASILAPNIRFRFTSPHPKDFPLALLQLIGERDNVCKQVHLPAQSGSNSVLDRMRRGYSRESYLELVDKIRESIPSVCLSTDMIAGFVGETDEDHAETLALMHQVGYDMAYMYAYSMREKTMAHRRYQDNVPEDVKQRRLRDIIDAFYGQLPRINSRFIGTEQKVLLEGPPTLVLSRVNLSE
jgi:MiaB/RimO family radical SAM methylthiotransferase